MSATPDTAKTTDHDTLVDQPFTNEEIVFLIKAVIAALRAPGWTFKNRKDLEKIGEIVIFGGKELRDLDDALYDRIFPHLKTIAIHLGKTLRDTLPDETKPGSATPGTATPGSATPGSATPGSATPTIITTTTTNEAETHRPRNFDIDPTQNRQPHDQEGT